MRNNFQKNSRLICNMQLKERKKLCISVNTIISTRLVAKGFVHKNRGSTYFVKKYLQKSNFPHCVGVSSQTKTTITIFEYINVTCRFMFLSGKHIVDYLFQLASKFPNEDRPFTKVLTNPTYANALCGFFWIIHFWDPVYASVQVCGRRSSTDCRAQKNYGWHIFQYQFISHELHIRQVRMTKQARIYL